MKCTVFAAALAVLPMSAGAATPFDTTAPLRHVLVGRDESVQLALARARFQTRMDAWRAATPAPAPAVSTNATTIQPSITGGAIVSTTLTVGQATSIPTVQVSYKTGAKGLGGLELVFTSPNGSESLTISYAPHGLTTGGTVTVAQPTNVPSYTQPGQWQLVAAYIEDYAGNFVSYSQSQLAALFPVTAINVVNNGPVDITPPVVTAGKILTPSVSLSSPLPVFAASLTGSDDVSGMYAPFVGILPPGGSFSQVDQITMPFPLLAGTGTAYSTVFPGQPTGTWSISFYALCDVAGNCFTDQSPTDIQNLFGTTTFQVTP